MKKILKKFANIFLGKRFGQSFFQFLHRLSLKGMNFGQSEVTESGEKYVLEYIKNKYSNSNLTIFDVGANMGQYGTLAAKTIGPSAEIYSYEPAKKTFEKLVENVNSFSNIKTYNYGFGEIKTRIDLHYDAERSGLASVYKRRLEHSNIDFNKKEEVEISTIDDFCRENKIERIDLLKLDIEGYELEALKGADRMLGEGKIENIQFEFGGANIDSKTYFQDFYYFLKDKYRISRILKNDLKELKNYSEFDEIFITVNYLAERRK